MANEHEIRRAGMQSWYVDSGLNRGVDPEVLQDLGYDTPEETQEIIDMKTDNSEVYSAEPVVRSLGRVVCGDCGEVVPCPHAGMTRQGRGYTKGY